LTMFAVSITPVFAQPSFAEDGVITLAELGVTEVPLNGPYDSTTIYFGLPADWSLTGGAQIDINLTTALAGLSIGNTPELFGGLLTVKFNRQTVAILPLTSIGTTEQTVDIPAYLFVSPRTDGRMELKFELDSGDFCMSNQQTNVVIHQSTRLTFSYEQVQPDTDLIAFPYPIYQDTIYPDFALVVVPDNPTSTEIQAALSVAAGFGNLTYSTVDLDLTMLSQLTDEQKTNEHLILVGQAASLPLLEELTLPLPVSNGSFQLTGNSDDGVVEMANSPWNISKVALVISGNTEAAVLKAAQAVSTGLLQSNSAPNLAIINTVRETPNQSALVIDRTLADLGNDVEVFSGRGVSSVEYGFYVPVGSVISSDAFFELAYGHSALLSMETSGIVVTLNGQPIGSVPFNDLTAAEAINTVRFSLPQTLALPGANRIGVRVSLEPLAICSNPTLEGLYANIWPQSRLSIPFTSVPLGIVSRLDLSNYPAPLSFDATMSGIAFVLQQDDLNTWKNALQVAKYLGDRSNGPISMPKVFLDGEFTDTDLVNYNLIVMGTPSQMSVMDNLNSVLPVPFEIGTDQVSNTYSQVVYRINIDTPQGYIELLPSPWNSEKIVLTALGNTSDGVTWAGSALGDSPLRGQLAGNFAVINYTQVKTTDTRLGQVVAGNNIEPAIQLPVVQQPLPFQIDESPSQLDQPNWILPALITIGVLIVITLIIVLIANSRKRKK